MNNSIVQTLKVNAVDVDGHTALIWAADKGNVEVANHLLSHPNIDPNLQVREERRDFKSHNCQLSGL